MDESNNSENDQPKDEQKPSDKTEAKYREISEEELRKIFEDSKKLEESYRNLISKINDQPIKKQQPSDETQTEYREISEDELKQILEDHRKWLESDGKEGKQADLINANLNNFELKKANLERAILNGANLKKAHFAEANLQEADLSEANLNEAELYDANLSRAILWKANLQNADLRGANLQNAQIDGNLQEANFDGAKLQKATLVGANLQNANFVDSNLQEANLSGANLQDAVLSKVILQRAELTKANLKKAHFRDVNLKNANVVEANLQKAELWEVCFENSNLYKAKMQNTTLVRITGLSTSNLQYADFQGATGLLGNEFAQADVTGTKLPDDIKEFKALEIVKETSQNARKIFFAMLLGCVYSWLTIATTTDVRLLTNTASSPLPIIGTEIPIAWFYIAAPLVLICLYFYFHLYLDNLWEGLASLPAIFPDGKRLDQRAYPWLLNTLVRKHFKRLKKRSLIARMKEWITIFLAWWVVPITMIAFWLRYIPRHEWLGTSFHIGLIVLSGAFGIIFYRLCALTLQGKEKIAFRLHKFWREKRFYHGSIVLVILILFSMLSYGAINGKNLKIKLDVSKRKISFYKIEELIPWAFEKLGYDVFVNFREKEVSEKPINYWEISEKNRFKSIKGAKLKGRNLNNANMSNAFLFKADLRGVSLNNAYLWKAILQQADLRNANLQQVVLRKAILQQASLAYANLQQASLAQANLQQANLRGANLLKTDLQEVNLLGADLKWAKNLTIDQLSKVKTLYKATLDFEILEQVKKCCPQLLENPKEEADQ